MLHDLPLLTADLPGINGRIKSSPESFVVEEIPAYEPCGEGEHIFLWIEKVDVSAEQLLIHLSRALGIKQSDIGMAGLKDRFATTRQWLSVPRGCEPRLDAVDVDNIRILTRSCHRNKLKTGHLRGNRFRITVAGTVAGDLARAESIRQRLLANGAANYFGEQRFGQGDATLQLGMSLLKGESSERDIAAQRRKFLTRLAISAAQSSLFNAVLAERIRDGLLQTVLSGDVLQVCASGGMFVCEAPAIDQVRFGQREVVTTGPMFGVKIKSPEGEALAREQRVLDASGINAGMWRKWSKLALGTRRPLLIHLREIALTQHVADAIEFSFELPSGAYATTLLREFVRKSVVDERIDRDD